MLRPSTSSREFGRRLRVAAGEVWADYRYANRRMIELQTGPVKSHRR
jgi:hypothetical protein